MLGTDVNSWGAAPLSTVPDGTRADSAQGVSITPGFNAYGSYAQVLGATSEDGYELEILINSAAVESEARDCLVTIGFDPAGGSSYTGLGGVAGNEIADLIGSCASAFLGVAAPGGVVYRFPLFIPAGTSIAAKASVNNATVGTLYVAVRVRIRPTRPELLRVGRFVRTFGATTASSSGTAVTPGGASEGAYVQLGAALTEVLWDWEVGLGVNSDTMLNTLHQVDVAVGDASNKHIVIAAAEFRQNIVETIGKPAVLRSPFEAAIGDLVYARVQSGPNNANSGTSVAVYGVGG